MVKLTNEEVRQLVLEEDKRKDVSIYIAVPIGIIAFISAVAALSAAVMMRALEYFRADVSAYWMSCVPFMFPVVTGIYAAYKKQFGLIGVHFAVTLLALLLGGFGFGLSVEPIFIDREKCVQYNEDLPCVREPLSWLYLISGCAAAGFALLGLALTICACYSAQKRITKRERVEHLKHVQEVEEKQKELRRQRALSHTSAASIKLTHPPPAHNGPAPASAPQHSAPRMSSPPASQTQPAQPPSTQSQSSAPKPPTQDNVTTAVKTGSSEPDTPATTTRL